MKSFLDYVRLSDELYEQAYSRNTIFREVESKEKSNQKRNNEYSRKKCIQD